MFNPNQNQNNQNNYNPNNYNPDQNYYTPNTNQNVPPSNSFDNRPNDYNEPLVGNNNQFDPYQTQNQGFPDMNDSKDIIHYGHMDNFNAFDLTSKQRIMP
jgi:hypothetical protein